MAARGWLISIALWFKSTGHEAWFYCYLTGCIAVSLLVYTLMRDTKKHSAIEGAQLPANGTNQPEKTITASPAPVERSV